MIAAVCFRNVSRHFGPVRAVDSVDLDIRPGEFFAMLGPSGSGKTTCLRLIAGFEEPTGGRIEIFGESAVGVPPYRRNVNTVFQDYALFPHLNVLDNVAYGLMVKGVGRVERAHAAEDALKLVQMPGYGARRPGQLSGGQRQRVALARALVNQPKVLLLDEPLGALDLKLRRQMQDELKALQKRVGTTFVHVTHDQEEAMALADHCIVMNDGRIEDSGAPERVYSRPATRFAATFMGESTLFPARISEAGDGRIRVQTSLGATVLWGNVPASAEGWLAVRPEHVKVGEAIAGFDLGEANVGSVVFQGSFKRVLARSSRDPSIQFVAKLPAHKPISGGDRISLYCSPTDLIVLGS